MAKITRSTSLADTHSFEFDKDHYNRLCGGAQLLVVQMIASSLNVTPQYFSNKDDVELKLDNNIMGAWCDEGNKVAQAIFRFEMRAKLKRKSLVSLTSDFLVAYSLPSNIDRSNAEAYSERSGLFAAYPYFRSYLAQINGLSNLELPTLPVLNSGPVKIKTGKSAAEAKQ